jgi:hypothetical protein
VNIGSGAHAASPGVLRAEQAPASLRATDRHCSLGCAWQGRGGRWPARAGARLTAWPGASLDPDCARLREPEQGRPQQGGRACAGAVRARAPQPYPTQTLPCPDPGPPAPQVLDALKAKGIAIRVASPKLVMEEAPESYKDVSAVVDTCHAAGISKKAVRLRPVAVIKG